MKYKCKNQQNIKQDQIPEKELYAMTSGIYYGYAKQNCAFETTHTNPQYQQAI